MKRKNVAREKMVDFIGHGQKHHGRQAFAAAALCARAIDDWN
jgi:hypothetical protein